MSRCIVPLLGLLCAGVLLVAGGCSDDDPVSATADPVAEGIWEIEEGAESLTTDSGLTIIHVETGVGKRPGQGSIVSVHYTGMLENGTIFDSSYPRGTPIKFALGQGRVIAGWDEGVALLLQGSKARLIIPPGLGYGARGVGNTIPPNATLIFDVWLVDVE